MTRSRKLPAMAALMASVSLATALPALPSFAQEAEQAKPSYPPVQTVPYKVGPFTIALRADTGTLARLSPTAEPGFDFTPANRLAERQYNGFNHIGDLHLRLRQPGGDWQDFNSAHERRQIAALAAKGNVFAAYDITASMGAGIPLEVTREWANEKGSLALYFTLTNSSDKAVEVGALGMPMVFDNIISDRDLEEAHAEASFVDPYIGRDAGYLQVTRLNGKGPSLLVLPEKGTPLEAYKPLKMPYESENIFTDKTQRGQTFEGFYDWTVASKGFAEKEWADAGQQWNEPTSFTLQPGESRRFGVHMVESPSIRAIEETLIDNDRPVAVGMPGYVIPQDLPADLFLHTKQAIAGFEAYPEGALNVTEEGQNKGWKHLKVSSGGHWGRARLTIAYRDGSKQTVSYFVTKPLAEVNKDLGHFTTTGQWYDDPTDPFHRSPAILTYDREDDKIVTQDPRVWIAGMSDEGGAGAWVSAMMKQLDNPDPAEVARLEEMVDETVIGHLQVADGEHKGGVVKSLFYYQPDEFPEGFYDPDIDWTSWTSWSKEHAADLGRSYNYPHVAAGHWVLYRLARNHTGLVTRHDWKFYLQWAYQTSVAMMEDAPYYAQFGQMEGDVFVDILKDLKREGMSQQAAHMEKLMRERVDHWRTLPFPFGSEMAWDSTGQPEVYAWMRYFGYQQEADSTREVILSYDPTIPSWGYNGNARRYWDFLYGGKYPRIERQIHHYGSALNAVPLFDAFRADPADFHLLRVAYGGFMGGITNIDQQGRASAAFHSWPDMMKWDPYTGDYGMGYFGHAYSAATYLVKHPTFGWLGFGGEVKQTGDAIAVTPKDGARSRLFIAPAGLWVTLEAGKIASARYTPSTGTVTLTLDPATPHTPEARLHIEQTLADGAPYTLSGGQLERDAYTVSLSSQPTDITLTAR
ncbi:hypothetical protein D6851_14065 [Altericroceibacterium spongiae]|uniref:Glycoside hydrolase n=1 Tax=Altericroceibacterium spongiae TaxID=2320269 RepID=A0A420EE19_9SPHN|nr:DUF5695 domain-containing protein [Altericroceibacterium spongiae]RKF18921.1 hypothetical protein D6851_14065 [Altericroceibacterium spongiae]